MSPLTDAFLERASKAQLSLRPGLADRLGVYFDLLSVWNRRINLAGFDLDVPTQEAVERIGIEPVMAAEALSGEAAGRLRGVRILDVGSGGGSPAIPVALSLTAAHLTMVESRVKKATFLKEALRAVGLTGDVVSARIEDVEGLHADAYGLVTVRAVRIDAAMRRHIARFLETGGVAAFFTSSQHAAALAAELDPLVAGPVLELPLYGSPAIVVATKA